MNRVTPVHGQLVTWASSTDRPTTRGAGATAPSRGGRVLPDV